MSVALQRATMLLSQGRTDLAERQLQEALAEDPDNGTTHALLAVCLLDRGDIRNADRSAERALALVPDSALAWAVYGNVLNADQRSAGAEHAATKALALAPDDQFALEVRARSRLVRGRHGEALEDVEQALARAPEQASLHALRASILTQLGRRQDADGSAAAALSHDPDSASAHATLGWQLLAEGDTDAALAELREALRIEPTNRWARLGLIESLKARNPVYARILRVMFWMSRGSRRWMMLAVLIPAIALVSGLGASDAPAALVIVLIGGVVLIQLARPIFDLVAWVTPEGRRVIDRDELRLGIVTAAAVALAAVLAGLWLATGDPLWALAAIPPFFYPMLASAAFRAPPGRPRSVARTLAVIAPLAEAAAVALVLAGLPGRDPQGRPAGAMTLIILSPVVVAWLAPSSLMSSTFRSLPVGYSLAEAISTGYRASRYWWSGTGLLLGFIALGAVNRPGTKLGGLLVMGLLYAAFWVTPQIWQPVRNLAQGSTPLGAVIVLVLAAGSLASAVVAAESEITR